MKKQLISFFSLLLLFWLNSSVFASKASASDLTVDFHVPIGTPVFSIINAVPGDIQEKPIDVTNTTSSNKIVSLKATRTDGVGDTPRIENVLTVLIKDGTTILYGLGSPTGEKTLQNLFEESSTPNGIQLSSVSSNQTKTYTLTITFPLTAGNDYQGKSVTISLIVGSMQTNSLVINEVYYSVDRFHWHNLVPDRRDHERDLDDGGWYRDWFWQRRWWVFRKDFQWIELYNPTDQDINLKNWTISGIGNRPVTIKGNKTIRAKSFALLSKDDSLWRYWNDPRGTLKIEIGGHFGDGLTPKGDRLILKNPQGTEIDRMSWGSVTSGFTPSGTNPLVSRGSSTARIGIGFDTNKATDWHEERPPTPGR